MIQRQFYEELKHVFDHFPKCHTKRLLGDVKAKVRRENFSNTHVGIRVYMRIVMIMLFEQ